ncbi:low molecular weight protein-tyrosine-phosphatase [Marinomonas colpomeniae]|uniref:protein-tyrosine-phosphatase n=1 Tax=Marinomonas colpomeniae TaxID=2774408 RepID=A0ABR8P1Q7_9GAMM|nr:low molecular weight protein-tyrosine-phosphatase [Marinomonas colpomeniae]MBD5772123.1 low molecular weight phosphotyrosine protein phosphatase [Marinomonas colpomeniae]
MKSFKVLTVCLGNICRSPAAQGILEKIASENNMFLELDSAGTAAYHLGKSPDPRSTSAVRKNGVNITGQKARQVMLSDFDEFDWILAMDKENLANLHKIQPEQSRAKLVMFGEFSSQVSFGEVDDPYYGGDEGFDLMREHLTEISNAFVRHLKHQI